MAEDVRWARTWLFVPGDRPERFAKAAAAGADMVIVDLEDAVGPESKGRARQHVVDWLAAGHRAAVRVNGTGSPWFADDVAALVAAPPAAVVLPKAESARDVAAVRASLAVPVLPIVESARGMFDLADICRAEGTCRIVYGSQDFAVDTGIDPDCEEAAAAARGWLVLASRAHDLPGPIDGPTRTWDDPGAVEAGVRLARRMGLTGKLCIHPAQVAPARRGFAPSPDEVAWARKVAATGTQGAARVGSEMVDKPVLDRALRILREAGEATDGD